MVSVRGINGLVITQPERRPPRTALSRPRPGGLASATSIRAFRGAFCLRLKREEPADGGEDDDDDDKEAACNQVVFDRHKRAVGLVGRYRARLRDSERARNPSMHRERGGGDSAKLNPLTVFIHIIVNVGQPLLL